MSSVAMPANRTRPSPAPPSELTTDSGIAPIPICSVGSLGSSPRMWSAMRRLVESAHEEVTRLLSDHRQQLENLAQALLRAETLDGQDAYAAAGVAAREREPAAVS